MALTRLPSSKHRYLVYFYPVFFDGKEIVSSCFSFFSTVRELREFFKSSSYQQFDYVKVF